MAVLPQEIIFDTLSKLPVKSLCRFKCVSKSFLTLFSDTLFIKTQYLSQTQKDRLLVLHRFDQKTFDLYLIDPKTSANDEKLTAKWLHFSKDKVSFIGSCNGLCCLYDVQRDIYSFYNPSTRESSNEIPTIMKDYPRFCGDYRVSGYGFGYAPSIDDYKMVIVFYWKHVTHVFSLRNNSWKTIHQHRIFLLREGTPFSGALRWLSGCPKKIVSFDLVEEKFRSFPPLPYNLESNFITLDVVDGCLCLLVTKVIQNQFEIWKNDGRVYEIWVMKEYGVVDSWTLILMSKDHHEKPIYKYNYLNLKLCLNGRMAFFDGLTHMLCYQEIDGTWKEVEVEVDCLGNCSYFCFVFTESLVSPNWYIGEVTNDH